MRDTFTVRIDVVVEKRDERGCSSGERLSTREEMTIPVSSFTDIAAVLGQFHGLGQKIRAEYQAREDDDV